MKHNKATQREYLAKLMITGVFLLLFAGFVIWRSRFGPGLDQFRLSLIDWGLLAFATFRLGRMIAYDLVMEPLRAPFAQTVPDSTGAGETVEPKGTGAQRALGQLISCPICAGTWVATFLVFGLYAFPGPTRVFLAIMAVIGAAEILNCLSEALGWVGQYARTLTGVQEMMRKDWTAADPYQNRADEYVIQDMERDR